MTQEEIDEIKAESTELPIGVSQHIGNEKPSNDWRSYIYPMVIGWLMCLATMVVASLCYYYVISPLI